MSALGKAAILLATFIVSGTVILMMFGHAAVHVDRIDEDVVLVTIDAVPDMVAVFKKGPEPDARVIRVKPDVVKPAPPRAQPSTPPQRVQTEWTLPYSCEDVKWANEKFSHAQLEAMRKARGLPDPTRAQTAQINACLKGEIK